MLSSNVNITVPCRSRSPSAGGTTSGRTQKWKRQRDGDFFTCFVGKGMLLVLMAVLSGTVCYSVVGAPPTPARSTAPTSGAHPEAWPNAAGNPADEAAAAAWVPREIQTGLPAEKVYEFDTVAKAGDVRHPPQRAAHAHAAGVRPPREGELVKGGPRYIDAGERHFVDLEEGDDQEVRGYVVAASSEGAKKKRLRGRDAPALTNGTEKGATMWRVPVHTSNVPTVEEEEAGQEEETKRGGEETMKAVRKSKKLHTEAKKTEEEEEEDERGEEEKMQEEDDDVRAEGKEEEEEGRNEEHTKADARKKVRKGEQAIIVDVQGEAKGDHVTTEATAGADKQAIQKAEDMEVEGALGLVRTLSLLERARQMLGRPLLSEQLTPFYPENPLYVSGNTRWCGREIKQNEGTPPYTIREIMRPLDALVWSIFKLPMFDFPIPFPSIQSAERAGPVQINGTCRYMFTVDLLPPLDDVRLYLTPSERQVGLTADRKVKRSEEGKAFSRVYGTETRLHAVASIAEGCMVSEELVKAGLIGWSYAGKSEGGMDILVAFPSEAHAKKMIERKELPENAYTQLMDGDGLEHLKPSERCLLSGRTESECDQLKAEAGGKHETALTVSTEGYEENQIRIPEFVYA